VIVAFYADRDCLGEFPRPELTAQERPSGTGRGRLRRDIVCGEFGLGGSLRQDGQSDYTDSPATAESEILIYVARK
jgi:hypothetical protein